MSLDDDRQVESLISRAGARLAPSADRTARVRAAAEEAWRANVRGRRRRQLIWMGGVGLAAAAGVIFIARVWISAPARPAPSIVIEEAGTIAAVSGSVTIVDRINGSGPVRNGSRAASGAVIETATGASAAMQLNGGGDLRLAANTRVVVTDSRTLALERGAIYIDSEGATPGSFIVRTEAGTIRDIGTRFEVQAGEGGAHVRVREGAVQLERGGAIHRAPAGTELSVRGGRVETRAIAPFDPVWNWVTSAAPAFHVEGATLESFLGWAAREGGWTIDASAVPTRVRATILHGSIAGLTATEALQNILATCGLTARISGGHVTIRAAQ